MDILVFPFSEKPIFIQNLGTLLRTLKLEGELVAVDESAGTRRQNRYNLHIAAVYRNAPVKDIISLSSPGSFICIVIEIRPITFLE